MTRRRVLWTGAAVLAGLATVAAIAGFLVIRSPWFYEQVRARMVSTVETATGGRVEISRFRFDWRRLRAEVQSFVIHGTEPPDKPPLFRASSITVGLRIVSLLKRDVDIQYLEVSEPRVYLMLYPDGRTNVPEPRIKGRSNAAETILNLAIGRFQLSGGMFEVESRGAAPFAARGRNLNAHFQYEAAGPRYRGDIAIQPLEVQLEDRVGLPFDVALSAAVEKQRVAVTSARIATGATSLEFSGSIDDLPAPRGAFQYDARVSLGDVSRIFHVPELRGGDALISGNGAWAGGSEFSATGNLRAGNVAYRDAVLDLRNGRLDGVVTAGPGGIDVRGAHIATTYFSSIGQALLEGTIHEIALRRATLDLRGVAVSALGGAFTGEAQLRKWELYTVAGAIDNFAARRVVALYSREPLPWDAATAGPLHLEGSLRRGSAFRASLTAALTPAAGSAPVHGQLTANYEARTGIVDVGRSIVTLPSSRADFSGEFGRQMRAHLETHDLNDLLPLLGANASSLPVRLENGTATFDGTVTGKLDHPTFEGRLTAAGFIVEGRRFDSLQADATASPENVHLRNAVVTHGALRADFDAAVGLTDWQAGDTSPIFGSIRIAGAPLADLLVLGGAVPGPVASGPQPPDLQAAGTVAAGAQFSGTVGSPLVKGSLEVLHGALRGEPFDRVSGQLAYANNTAELSGGELAGGARHIEVTAAYRHAAGDLVTGRLHFRLNSNAMALDQIRTLTELRPGIEGVLELSATGDLDIGREVRLEALEAEVSGRELRLTGQQLGNAHLTVRSSGPLLTAHLDADFANSAIRGDGTVRLAGDYPGDANLSFSRLDFAQLRAWIAPSDGSAAARFAGYAEGQMHLSGPALQPARFQAEVRLPKLEIGPAPGAGLPASLALHNSGPIVAAITNSAVTISSARLAGRDTDVAITGRILLDQKEPLDLRVNGRADLAMAHEFNSDLIASGGVSVDAGIRGALDAPRITGRVQLQKASFNVVDFPNGISNASGDILFAGDRATIQDLSGETGGGQVRLSGFASYEGSRAVFHLNARATQVRVRYPEGVSTVADADLHLTGASDRSTIAGTITILRTGINLQSDFSSLIAKSAEPVRTPSARTGILGGVNFDVQIETAPDIQFQSSLTQDLQVDANLRLRGNITNPALIGRININQGQVVFFGTRFTINQGSIAFYNPLKVDPVMDVDLETKARGVDVTLTISGPLNKLNLTPRSDPPLQFSEIVSLLATGETPVSDPALLAQQTTAPQAWQQMGASALLGQAIATPVTGRLQRFFGVSRLRIDPTLPGVETNNPQARVTLEQQVTRDITFTYITVVTSSNPQVVRVDWSLSKQWSLVALREENGVFGLDFFFKRRF